ncbi:MAG: IS91 family transposase [Lachnospiraceae bacterium]|nr:IS91 family transposase [Lachnospiraceae bacterium]
MISRTDPAFADSMQHPFRTEQISGAYQGNYPIREIFRRFYPSYEAEHQGLDENKRKTARMIMACKTGELGYSLEVCPECGVFSIHNASCNNRSCPCCQHPQEKKWVAERKTELIEGIAYYHVIITLPEELNPLIRANEKLLLTLFFHCVNDTLLSLCEDKRYMGAKPAIMAVLHTWGQKLNYHPHIHVCLSGGGLTKQGSFVESRHKGFIIPQPVIAASFRGRFLCSLKKLYETGQLSFVFTPSLEAPEEWKEFIDALFDKQWMPFLKETFNGKGNAIEYLGRYSYRTAISNSRILSIENEQITFRYKDYKDGKMKTRTVSGSAFIGMFLQHILPKGFSRIRYAGYITNGAKKRSLKLIHKLRGSTYQGNPYRNMKMRELILTLFNRDIGCCPHCQCKEVLTLVNIRGKPGNAVPAHPSTPIAALS